MSARRKASTAAAADHAEPLPHSSPIGKKDKNAWVSLQAALGKKDDELVELREQHDQLISRSRDALQNWEAAMQAKDHVIQQLQFALRAQLSALERQEKINEDVRQRLTHKDLVDQDKDVIESRDKGEDSLQQLSSELRSTVSDLRNQLKAPDDTLHGRIQALETALQMKEKELRQQENLSKELKASLSVKNEMLRISEVALHSVLSRQEASFEVFEYLKVKLDQDKSFMRKTLSDLNDEIVDSKVHVARSSSKSPSRSKSFQKKTREKVEDILSRISKGRTHSQADSRSGSEDDSSRDESPYFWLRAVNRKGAQEDLSPLINEIGRLEGNWRKTEARMRAEITRRAIDLPASVEQQR